MPNIGTTAANQALDGMANGTVKTMDFVTLNSAAPGSTGANELAGGGYARQACTWNAASGGTKTNSASMTFTTNGTTQVTHFGTSSASAAGTYGIGGALASGVTAATITVAAGALTVSAT